MMPLHARNRLKTGVGRKKKRSFRRITIFFPNLRRRILCHFECPEPRAERGAKGVSRSTSAKPTFFGRFAAVPLDTMSLAHARDITRGDTNDDYTLSPTYFANSTSRLLYPHSLSYHPNALTRFPPMTCVKGPSIMQLLESFTKS